MMRMPEWRVLAAFALVMLARLCPAQLPVDPAVTRQFEARAVEVQGEVSRKRDALPWVVEQGERVPIGQLIRTGRDGFARFTVNGGSEFTLFSNSSVAFRSNTPRAGDLLDVIAGRVRVRLQPMPGQWQQRVFTAIATVSATQPALISLAIDEDQNVRLDVLEGEVRVQHRLLPRNEPTLVRAVDAILVRRDQQLIRTMDRGTLYRYTVKPLHDLWTAVLAGHSHVGDPVEGNKFQQAELRTSF